MLWGGRKITAQFLAGWLIISLAQGFNPWASRSELPTGRETRKGDRSLCRGVITDWHRGSMPPLHVPCCPCSTSATAPAHALRTRIGWRAALFLTLWRHHCNIDRSRLALTLGAALAGARARHRQEMASQDSHERPVHPAHAPPSSQRGPHLSCPCAAHHPCYAPSCRQGGAVGEPRDGRGFDD